MGEHRPRVYVIAHDRDDARNWARLNKPGHVAKACTTSTPAQAGGLHLKDEAVYVLNEMTFETRDAWLRTGCRLVYV